LTEQQSHNGHLYITNEPKNNLSDDMDQWQDEIIKGLRAGSHTAAIELVDRYYKKIYWFMRRLGHRRSVSEDLTQDCFIQVWQHIGQLRNAAALNSWIYRIALNASRQYLRSNKIRKTSSFEGYDQITEDNSSAELFEAREEIDKLKEFVSQLPDKQQKIIILHYMEQLTIYEVSQVLNIRQGTVKSRLNRGLEQLRRKMS